MVVKVSYKKLWKLLIDKDMMKKDLEAKADISTYTIGKLRQNKNVNVDVLARICRALDCTVDDIMEVLPEEKVLSESEEKRNGNNQ